MDNQVQDLPLSDGLRTIKNHLAALYGESAGESTFHRLIRLMEEHAPFISKAPRPLDQSDAILITYADQVLHVGEKPLRSLIQFCEKWLPGVVSGIHLLPFYPFSSDDGFSVIDYTRVNPELGSWEDITNFGRSFRLMFDAVINHISVKSLWFRGFLQEDPRYREYFISLDAPPDLSLVFRPRQSPLLTSFKTKSGIRQVWTTFSDDQVDLNFHNPEVLLEILEVILLYISKGAEILRLDAVAYLWKEIGTACIHLPRTHQVVQLLRSILDYFAYPVLLITETNVAHQDNVSYFGDGMNEAHLVYNFALPPLVLHTFHSGDARPLSRWVNGLSLPSNRVTFFNFLASHDGIGVTPARELIRATDCEHLVQAALVHGGYVSYRDNEDGSRSPYELNINYFDALSDPHSPQPAELAVNRFVAAHAIMFCLVGVPGIYFHSLFGSQSWTEGVKQTGRYRTINRQKLDRTALEQELEHEDSIRAQVFSRLSHLLRIRSAHPAFNPYGSQQALDYDRSLFALLRIVDSPAQAVLCVHNVTSTSTRLNFQPGEIWTEKNLGVIDRISGEEFDFQAEISLNFDPYQVRWLSLGLPEPDNQGRSGS